MEGRGKEEKVKGRGKEGREGSKEMKTLHSNVTKPLSDHSKKIPCFILSS